MLNEPASSASDRPRARLTLPRRTDPSPAPALAAPHETDAVREKVARVLNILYEQRPDRASETLAHESLRETLALVRSARYLGSFSGALLLDSEAAYDQLDADLTPLDAFAVFRQNGNAHVVHVFSGRAAPEARSPWVNIALFIVTFLSVLIVGTEMAISEIAGMGASAREVQALVANFWGELWRGLPYAIAILLILGAHELGHYFAGRRHKLAVTLPYFIPMPFNAIGTFGAFIQLRQAMRNRKVLLDVGLAGPLMGLVFAIPIVIIGLATSPVRPITPGIVEGNSFLYALVKTILFGEFLPNGAFDVYVNQLAWAGWTGLLITGLNLIPIGQLDGGHVLYALIGERARRLYLPLMVAMGALVLFTISISPVWVVWLFLLIFFGRVYAVPLDNITPLDPARRRWALLGLFMFVVTFVPLPLAPIEPSVAVPGATALHLTLPAAAALLTVWTRRRRA